MNNILSFNLIVINTLQKLLLVLSVLFASDVFAHHSFANSFDIKSWIQISGELSRVTIRSPHSILEVKVENESGETEIWEVETHSVVLLRRMGVTKDVLQVGDQIQISGLGPRNPDDNFMFGGQFRTASGKFYEVFDPDVRDPPGIVTEPQSVRGFAALSGTWMPGFPPVIPAATPMPLSDAGKKAYDAFDPADTAALTCEPPNIPSLLYAPYLFQSRVDENNAYLHFEYYNVSRELGLDNQWTATKKTEFGRSRAYRDGVTLVVESRDFPISRNGLAVSWDSNGLGTDIPSGPDKTLIERYSVNEIGTEMYIDIVVEDPLYLSEPYRDRVTMYRMPELASVMVFDCDKDVASWSTQNADR